MRSILLLSFLTQVLAFPTLRSLFRPEQAVISQGEELTDGSDITAGWVDPRINGGRFLDYTLPQLGEPLNIIISGLSDPFILTEDGFHNYAKSIGYSEECLGLHYGNIHKADLGDGEGKKAEMFLARQYYFPIWGTCWESFAGGHHFRAWKQNGTAANSGAWFIGASKEEHSRKNHKIVEDGYNVGRDWLVDRAVSGSHFKGIWWKAEVDWRTGLLEPGNDGVNHGIEQDGRVALLTVRRL
ncbi:hypothetical protein EW146_g2602 [Bondarzewia mesenterica]|uniref:Uncharacterized protein n=1 Tax=Bondarzewia mesenterica TaxID=1095465 RepID=A0A4S4M2F1_9AGAM|nr:hypothetical protein EW146_g2602 [Bondarzewia mesenterica]